MEDFENTVQRCDDSWHLISKSDEKKLEELRIMKMAAVSLVNAYLTYQNDLRIAESELFTIDNPDKKIARDYDPE